MPSVPPLPASSAVHDLFRDAAAAAQAGDKRRAAGLMAQGLDLAQANGETVHPSVYFPLALMLFELGQLAESEQRAREGLAALPKDFALHNLLGVVLKTQGKFDAALAALDTAHKLDPKQLAPLVNRGEIYLEQGDGKRAVPVFQQLVRAQPQQAEPLRQLGLANRLCGEPAKALKHFALAREKDPKADRAWVDGARLLRDMGRHDEALALLEQGRKLATHTTGLLATQAQVLRGAGRSPEAMALLRQVVEQDPKAAWAHFQLGLTAAPFDRDAANGHYRQAVALAPRQLDYLAELADSLQRTRSGDEAANLQEAYELAQRCLQLPGNLLRHARGLGAILERCGDHGTAQQRLGSFDALGRFWASTNQPGALLNHLARVASPQDRRQLLEHHRIWGRSVEAMAARSPLARKPRSPERAASGKIRVGFMSSDLRNHPVSYFLLALLEGYDKARFEIYGYSWSSRAPDKVQEHIAKIVDKFVCVPDVSARDAAQLMADDALDILFELGGTTEMNKLEAMAWRPAPLQASWMGYPHSSGLSCIDYLVADPYVKPPEASLLVEKPLELAHAWIVLGRLGFNDRTAILPGTPQERHNGRLSFGTMNNPYKYRPDTLAAWAEVVRRVPGSRFVFVRPEGGTPAFRDNICRAFEASGVSRERVDFIPVRGTHLQHYNEIDIALDSFPQTGGTTTCECLWMGVPVVTLVGQAFFERLSYSVLVNTGLADLCAFTREEYVDKALALAADLPRRQALRAGLRAQMRSQPIGNTRLFIDDFQRAVEAVVRKGR
jgi:predicted O-linked N-acetylglucosamine transferase (SPINDLY family)